MLTRMAFTSSYWEASSSAHRGRRQRLFPRWRGGDVERLCARLRDAHETSVAPGKFFGMPDHFRIGIGGETQALQAGLERLAADLDPRHTNCSVPPWSLQFRLDIECWRRDCSQVQPHASLGRVTPAAFATQAEGLRSAALPYHSRPAGIEESGSVS